MVVVLLLWCCWCCFVVGEEMWSVVEVQWWWRCEIVVEGAVKVEVACTDAEAIISLISVFG